MPLVYRVMKKDEDDRPLVGSVPNCLGVRPGVDIDTDADEMVLLNGKGMSVYRSWRDIFVRRIPRRLRHLVPGADGPNSTSCFRFGEGAFQQDEFAEGLVLVPDTETHGNVTPSTSLPLAEFQVALGATRAGWQIDET